MGSIVLDEIKVRNNVIPNLSRTKNIMQDAYSTCTSLRNSLPSSFSSRSMVSSIATKIASSERKVTDAYNNINFKMDYVKRIESKTESKVSSLASTASKIGTSLGMITGAAIGSAGGVVGTAVGAATGAVVGKATGEIVGKIVETGAKVVKNVVSGVKNVVVGVFNFFKDTGSKIAKGVKSIWEKAAGKVKEIASKTKEVVSSTFNKIKDTGAKVVKGVTSTVKKVVTTTKDLAVKAGTSIAKGAKSVWNFISSTAKKVGNTVKDVTTKAVKAVKNTGAKIVNGVKGFFSDVDDWFKKAGASVKKFFTSVIEKIENATKKLIDGVFNYLKDLVEHPLKTLGKTLASVVNFGVSLVEGVFSFAEAIVDTAVIVVGGAVSIFTAAFDIGYGLAGGGWDFKATKGMWSKGLVPFIATDWTSKGFEAFPPFKFLNKHSYDLFKRDGTIYAIGKGVGYYTGMIAATILTCGAASGAVGASSVSGAAATKVVGNITLKTVAQAGMGAAGSFGKNTQKNFSAAQEVAKAENRELSGMEILGSIGKAGGTALIDGGIYFAAGAVGDNIKAYQALEMAGVQANPTRFGAWASDNVKNIDTAIKASKAYISEGYNCLINGEEFDWTSANLDALSIITAESAARWLSNKFYKPPSDSKIEVKPKVEVKTEAVKAEGAASALSQFETVSGENVAEKVAEEVAEEVAKNYAGMVKETVVYTAQNAFSKAEEKLVKEVASTGFESAFAQ